MNASETTAGNSADELTTTLTRLETALLTPAISGELESWARAVQDATTELEKRLPAYVQNVWHPQYAEIARSDQELLTRVEQLIADDQNLVAEQIAFSRRVAEFSRRAGQVKKDEAQLAAERQQLEQDGI